MDLMSLARSVEPGPIADWIIGAAPLVKQRLSSAGHGDYSRWRMALDSLPPVRVRHIDLDNSAITVEGEMDMSPSALEEQLQQLHPWRKGPYHLLGVDIDTEWRSDLKWDRLSAALDPLDERRVLDIGCGNGYHCWRALGAGAGLVIGIDPTLLFVMQFQAVQHFIDDPRAWVLPLATDDLPGNLTGFDTVFSMGVLYHRRSPMDHLLRCRSLLRSGGQLVLETLVIEGGEREVLIPRDRYARMRNVWFIPSVDALAAWARRCGFRQVKVVDTTATTPQEQRSTDWMRFHSLPQFLNPENPAVTVEGYPAPKRCVLTARA
ncbi:MAG: tRNA 5-methoxyuridine(34)/uridine 5-oxyacetic acid(34) synthase CmoB [Xanthomonadales bacterium]|nr:tRNA 5-methoxyuridine(34)/uridine 5-oxyacetic acid(34) synthase CmoB [Xanthomonadales bacterium]